MKPDRQRADSRAPEQDYDEDGLRRALGLKDADRPEHIVITDIRRDGGTQPRAKLNESVIDEYAAEMKAGARFPPVEVVYDGADYWMWDGFHRVAGAEKAGLPTIEAHITQGTRRDAVLLSVGVNAEHGLRRTNEDKRRAVMTLLSDPEWGQWADREIAKRAKVSNTFVSNMRASLSTVDSEERTYTTKHGTTATMNTSKIRQANQQRAQPSAPQSVAPRESSPRLEPPAPRVQGTAQPSGKFDGVDPDRLANLLRVLNGAPPVIAMFIRHLSDEEVAFMRRLESDKLAPRPEVLLVLDRRLGPSGTLVALPAESIPDHDPAYGLDLEPDEQPDMVTDNIPGDEQAIAYRLLTDLSTALQELRSMALALPKLGDLDALAVLDDTALDGVLDLINDTGADLAGHEDHKGQWVPGLLDHLAGWRTQVQEMLDDG